MYQDKEKERGGGEVEGEKRKKTNKQVPNKSSHDIICIQFHFVSLV